MTDVSDSEISRVAEAAGWRVIRIWEHELVDMSAVIAKIDQEIPMDFTCPKCTAKVHNQREVGCPACGFGKPHTHEQRQHPDKKPTVEAPPGFNGEYLTEVR